MPKTPPTIVAPLPSSPRVLALAKAVGISKREAFAAAAEAWAWMAVEAVDDIVPQTEPDALDSVVDIAGFGQAMLQTGLVGVVNDGLVLPAELRRQQRDERGNRSTATAEDHEDKVERERKQARVRQRRSRRNKALTEPDSKTTSPSPTAEDTRVKWTPRRLGTVDGHDVMLLYSPKTQAWFYCLKGASPKEWTASVADPQNPSFAEALAGLHGTIKREDGKGLGGGDTFRPSLKAVVDAAERYRAERAAAAADAARRDEGNKALAEASVEDQDDIDHEPAERDCHAPVTVAERDSVTVTLLSRSGSVTCPSNSSGGKDLGNVECHAPVTEPAPSSSSSLSLSGSHEDKSKEDTTTTSSVTPRQRDHEDDILDRLVPRKDPVTEQRERKRLDMAERFAAGLGSTVESVLDQWRYNKPTLLARLLAAGIDPNTGHPLRAHHEPADARDDAGVTTEPIAGHEPAAGSVDAGGDVARREDEDPDRPRHGPWETMAALKRLGIQPPTLNVAPGRGHRLEDIDLEREDQTSLVTARGLA
jgi:hypothetical protein